MVKRIAVIDDEDLVRRSVTRMLERAGHEVIGYEDASLAIDSCPFDDVDLILTDLAMPTSGTALIRDVRDRGIDTPIVVMSGDMRGRTNEEFRLMGAQATLNKPFDLEVLIHLVEELTSRPC